MACGQGVSGGLQLLSCLWQLYVWQCGGGGDGVRLVTHELSTS